MRTGLPTSESGRSPASRHADDSDRGARGSGARQCLRLSGRKPDLARLLIESAISGSHRAVPRNAATSRRSARRQTPKPRSPSTPRRRRLALPLRWRITRRRAVPAAAWRCCGVTSSTARPCLAWPNSRPHGCEPTTPTRPAGDPCLLANPLRGPAMAAATLCLARLARRRRESDIGGTGSPSAPPGWRRPRSRPR
jgi:hypothetical protein